MYFPHPEISRSCTRTRRTEICSPQIMSDIDTSSTAHEHRVQSSKQSRSWLQRGRGWGTERIASRCAAPDRIGMLARQKKTCALSRGDANVTNFQEWFRNGMSEGGSNQEHSGSYLFFGVVVECMRTAYARCVSPEASAKINGSVNCIAFRHVRWQEHV